MFEFLGFTKSFSFERATASKRLSNYPAILFSAHMVAGAGGAATATLYDGHTNGGDPKVDLSAPASGSDPRTFVPPIYFDQGIYLVVGSNVTSVFIMMKVTRDIKTTPKSESLISRFASWFSGPKDQ